MNSYKKHYKDTLRLGIPLCVGQVCVILVGFADTIMVGHYSTDALASVSFVTNFFNLAVFTLLGFSYGITPIIGSLFARQDYSCAGATFRSAFAVNIVFGVLLTLVMGGAYFFLDSMGQPAELMPIIKPYYLTVLASMIFVAIFNALRQFADSLLRPSVGMWIQIAGNAVNIIFNYLLIYGKLGFPELGALGAGVSTLGARILMAVVFVVVLMRGRAYAEIRKPFLRSRARWCEMWKVAVISLPIALQLAMETGMFTVGGVMIGWLGTVELATYQVVITLATLGYMFYYSLGSAITIRVANYYGRDERGDVRRAAWAGYHVILAVMLIFCVSVCVFRQPMVEMFTSDGVVVAAAFLLLPPLVIYQCGDAAQICFANALRGTSKSMSMMWIAFVAYVLVGIPAGYVMGFTLGLGSRGVFYGFGAALFLAGVLFFLQFLKASKPLQNHN